MFLVINFQLLIFHCPIYFQKFKFMVPIQHKHLHLP